MEQNYRAETLTSTYISEKTRIQNFFTKTYAWMFLALLITAMAAITVANIPTLTNMIIGNPLIFYGLFVIEIGIVIFLSARMHKMSVAAAAFSLILYALINGMTLSVIFLAYSFKTIGIAFLTASLIYGLMALYGFFTKADLSPIASFLFIALVGGLIVTLINIFFLKSAALDTILSIVFVLIFAGLTAYDHQKLKDFALQSHAMSKNDISKMAIYGALSLYLDFINIFLHLLSIFGDAD